MGLWVSAWFHLSGHHTGPPGSGVRDHLTSGEPHALGLLSVGDRTVLLDDLVDGDLVEILQIETRLPRLEYVADDVVQGFHEEKASSAATQIQISESVHVAGAAVVQEVYEIIVVMVAEHHIVSPWSHHEDTLRAPKAGPEEFADAVVAPVL